MRVLSSSRFTVPTLHLSSSSSLYVCRRHLSLSELAKAFTEMSESDNTGKTVSSASAADSQRSRMTEHVKSVSSRNNNNNNNNNNNTLTSSDMKWNKETRLVSNSSNIGVVTFSIAYSNSLSSMTASQLLRMLETECKRLHHGHIIQCLMEVWCRLRKAPPLEIIISDDEACGEKDNTTASFSYFSSSSNSEMSWFFRSDDLLEGVLRALAKTNMEGLQESNMLVTEFMGVDHNPNSIKGWVTEFGRLVMEWLTARAAFLDASRSATFLHLIAQQKLFHCDAVLETLRDNIEVYFLKQHTLCTSTPIHSVETFGVSGFGVLLDAIARWQMGFVRVLKADGVASRYFLDTNNITMAISRYHHPILSGKFYNLVIDGLLRGIRNGSLHLTRQASSTTFLFLTLALAKIRWFRADCIEVLLPQLHEALTVFPAQFFAVVLLLGRREVKVCAVETTELLLQVLSDAMQKRGRRYSAVDTRRRHKTDAASIILAASSSSSSSSSSATTTIATGGAEAELQSITSFDFTMNDEMCTTTTTTTNTTTNTTTSTTYADNNVHDGDISDNYNDDFQLFSTSSLTTGDYGNTTTFSKNTEKGMENSSLPRMVFTTSFIDIRSMPVFLDSLHHILSITHEYCETHGRLSHLDLLNTKSKILYDALLNDTHASVKSIHALIASPDLVEKLLRSVLTIPLDNYHPLLVELAYAFTRHVGMRRVAATETTNNTTTTGGNSNKKNIVTTPFWQKRVLSLVEMLILRGILTPDTYIMSEEVVSIAPRVVEEVEAEKKRILERYCERQERLRGKSVDVGKRKVRLGAVFSKFSRVVGRIKEQQNHL
ncbi:uncharacterized protein TM35_000012440 [Trypanosoma theileri]|uniref:Uncharacterized protein n=1 Tax=Trypanosoma theileri TaxID=67003 RepID=A0A1X0P8V0_9TRYP|nr:uncharacterized protein TM35_000012440 [Trypanosoma theileri]ORC93367.1 hypothetical protein TM35_000012440 [Trypanosoma theileri]